MFKLSLNYLMQSLNHAAYSIVISNVENFNKLFDELNVRGDKSTRCRRAKLNYGVVK